MEALVFVIGILWFILCFIVADAWRSKGLNYGAGFWCSFFFSPIVGILLGILYPTKIVEVQSQSKDKESLAEESQYELSPWKKKLNELWKKKLKESEFVDIKLLSCSVFSNVGVKILKERGFSEEEAKGVIKSLPLTLMRNVPKEKVREICEKLEEGFEIDVVVPTRAKANS